MTTVILIPGVSASPWVCPAGVFTLTQVICTGESGAAGNGVAASYSGGGAGAGGCSEEDNVAVTPGSSYAWQGGTGAQGIDTVFPGDAVTVTAHRGSSASGMTGGAGGPASGNTISFPGGSGGNGATATSLSQGGGGGGGSAGNAGAGGSGGSGSSTAGGAAGTAGAGTGSAPGGAGQPQGQPGTGGTGGSGTAPGGAPGGGRAKTTFANNGGSPAAGQIILIYTAASNTTVTGTAGTIAAGAPAGTAGVGPAGTAGTASVRAPAGTVVLTGSFTIPGAPGIISVTALPGTVTVSPAGARAAVTVTSSPGSLRLHLSAPATAVPPSAFSSTLRRKGLPESARRHRRAAPLLLQGTARYSAVIPVQAPPMTAWAVRSQVTASGTAAWNTRQLVAAPAAGTYEIEVLPIGGIPAAGVQPQTGWNVLRTLTAASPLAVSYTTRQAQASWAPQRRLAAAGVSARGSAAIQAAGPPVAWRVLGPVAASARAAWNTRTAVIQTGYTAWNTGPGGHGIVIVTCVITWNMNAQAVIVTGTAAWNTRMIIPAAGTAAWAVTGHLAVTGAASWRLLGAVILSRYQARRQLARARLRRGVRVGGGTQSAAVSCAAITCISTWQAHGLVTVTAAAAWEARSAVIITEAVTWNTRTLLAATSPRMSWQAASTTHVTQAAAWNIRNPVAIARISSWNILIRLAQALRYPQQAPASSGARGRHLALASRHAGTAVLPSGAGLQAAARWNTRLQVTTAGAATWNTLQSRAQQAIVLWDINPTIAVPARTSVWNVRARITATSPQVTWETRASLTVTAHAAWGIIQTIRPAGTAAWNLLGAAAAASPPIRWQVGQGTQSQMRAAAMDEWYIAE